MACLVADFGLRISELPRSVFNAEIQKAAFKGGKSRVRIGRDWNASERTAKDLRPITSAYSHAHVHKVWIHDILAMLDTA